MRRRRVGSIDAINDLVGENVYLKVEKTVLTLTINN